MHSQHKNVRVAGRIPTILDEINQALRRANRHATAVLLEKGDLFFYLEMLGKLVIISQPTSLSESRYGFLPAWRLCYPSFETS